VPGQRGPYGAVSTGCTARCWIRWARRHAVDDRQPLPSSKAYGTGGGCGNPSAAAIDDALCSRDPSSGALAFSRAGCRRLTHHGHAVGAAPRLAARLGVGQVLVKTRRIATAGRPSRMSRASWAAYCLLTSLFGARRGVVLWVGRRSIDFAAASPSLAPAGAFHCYRRQPRAAVARGAAVGLERGCSWPRGHSAGADLCASGARGAIVEEWAGDYDARARSASVRGGRRTAGGHILVSDRRG